MFVAFGDKRLSDLIFNHRGYLPCRGAPSSTMAKEVHLGSLDKGVMFGTITFVFVRLDCNRPEVNPTQRLIAIFP